MNAQQCHPLTLARIQSWLTPRPVDAHKGLFGRVLVIGSDTGMPGAVRLAAEGAARTGAGLVTVATRKAHLATTMNGRPELLCYGIESSMSTLDALLQQASVIVLGPGLGQSTWSKHVFDRVIASSKPMLIDADGLNWLARTQHTISPRANWVLTPHPGEAARLLGITTSSVQTNRTKAIQSLQTHYGGVIVLKGATSLIAAPDEPITPCIAGNPGMASAGMGDLLSGVIAGFIAQGLTLWQSACAGVLIHAMAGDRVAARQGLRGILASDLFVELSWLINQT